MISRRRTFQIIAWIITISIWLFVNIAFKVFYINPSQVDSYYYLAFGIFTTIFLGNMLQMFLRSHSFTRLVEMQFTRVMLVRIGFVGAAAIAILVAISS